MRSIYNILCLILLVLSFGSAAQNHHRRILHQPFFPTDSFPPIQPPCSSPQSQPKQQQQPKLPFSSSSSSSSTQKSFFPTYHSPPPSPPSPTALATFPANISSLLFPQPSSPNTHPIITVAVSVSLFSAALIAALAAFIYYRRHRKCTAAYKASRSDSLRLYPPNTATSDGTETSGHNYKPRGTSSPSSESLYLGTGAADGITATNSSSAYQKLGSPELKPLPPLPRHNFRQQGNSEDDEEEFFSPRGSSSDRRQSPVSSSRRVFQSEVDNFGSKSFNSRTPSYPCSNSASPTYSVSITSSPSLNLKSYSSGHTFAYNQNLQGVLWQGKNSVATSVPIKLPPPPPPPPPPRFWEMPVEFKYEPSETVGSEPVSSAEPFQDGAKSISDKNEETTKPKLKALHWDKVRASSDRAMVWDQLKPSSFQLNEEMIETLFIVNNTSFTLRDNARRQFVISSSPTENRVLDPKKSQNIAILLRALNVTIDEVCEALREGNCDTLGTELLESLLKMAPTKDEECKLKEFKDESPFKLGPAEKFLKVILDIPFAFKRVDAMLYIGNFDSEVEYLRKSFETLEVACEELRNSRMFLKLLEAVLKTGNRMNVGTNRGDAHAFKLDTLLKLVDIKGTDGKTTLLHFVVQEIVRTEGSLISGANYHQNANKIQQSTLQNEVEFRKLGLQVVTSLSGELINVKKAAAMDSDMLSKDVAKLSTGIAKVADVFKLNEESPSRKTSQKFSEAMKGFLRKGEEEIFRIQAQEKNAFALVKGITEYFHGDSAKEEAHRFRIFIIVRDFLKILDGVCKEVGKVNERTLVSVRRYPMPSIPILLPDFPDFTGGQPSGSSDDETSRSS